MKSTALAALSDALLTACAPHAWNKAQATGFNALRNMIATECAPLMVGPMPIMANYQAPHYALDQYDQWSDQASRPHYKKNSPETCAENIGNFFPGERTAQSTRCLISKLPPAAERPASPR
jgi:hypothetical protein